MAGYGWVTVTVGSHLGSQLGIHRSVAPKETALFPGLGDPSPVYVFEHPSDTYTGKFPLNQASLEHAEFGQRRRFLLPGERAPPGAMPRLPGDLGDEQPVGISPRTILVH